MRPRRGRSKTKGLCSDAMTHVSFWCDWPPQSEHQSNYFLPMARSPEEMKYQSPSGVARSIRS
jgi:hypothetical protein